MKNAPVTSRRMTQPQQKQQEGQQESDRRLQIIVSFINQKVSQIKKQSQHTDKEEKLETLVPFSNKMCSCVVFRENIEGKPVIGWFIEFGIQIVGCLICKCNDIDKPVMKVNTIGFFEPWEKCFTKPFSVICTQVIYPLAKQTGIKIIVGSDESHYLHHHLHPYLPQKKYQTRQEQFLDGYQQKYIKTGDDLLWTDFFTGLCKGKPFYHKYGYTTLPIPIANVFIDLLLEPKGKNEHRINQEIIQVANYIEHYLYGLIHQWAKEITLQQLLPSMNDDINTYLTSFGLSNTSTLMEVCGKLREMVHINSFTTETQETKQEVTRKNKAFVSFYNVLRKAIYHNQFPQSQSPSSSQSSSSSSSSQPQQKQQKQQKMSQQLKQVIPKFNEKHTIDEIIEKLPIPVLQRLKTHFQENHDLTTRNKRRLFSIEKLIQLFQIIKTCFPDVDFDSVQSLVELVQLVITKQLSLSSSSSSSSPSQQEIKTTVKKLDENAIFVLLNYLGSNRAQYNNSYFYLV